MAERAAGSAAVGGPVELTRRFIDALNARDLEALRELVKEDVELRKPEDGGALEGEEGLGALVLTAADANVELVIEGDEAVKGNRVEVPVRVILGSGDDVRGTAVFQIRGGRIAAFEVISELVR